MSKLQKLRPQSWRGFSFTVFKETLGTFRPALKGERAGILTALFLTLIASLLELLQPWPLKFILDQVIGGKEAVNIRGISKPVQAALAAGGFLLIVALSGAIALWAAVVGAKVSRNVTLRIRRQVFSHLHRLAIPFHQSNLTGDLLQRLGGDVDGVRDLIFASWVPIVERFFFFLGTALVMAFAVDYKYALLAVAPLPVYIFLVGRGNRKLKVLVRNQRRRQSKFTSLANESLQQIKLVKAFAAEDAAVEAFAGQVASGEHVQAQAAKLNAKIEMVSEICRATGVALVLFVGAVQVLAGRLSPGSLVLMASYVRSMYRPLAKLSQQGSRLSVSVVSAERLMEVLRIPAEDPGLGIPAPAFAGDVEFDSVRYEHEEGVEALRGLSFKVGRGDLAVLSGPNGSGKSTAIAVLLRLIRPQSGRVLIDGEPVDQYQLDSYRRRFAYVPQDVQLFAASIRENILYGRPDASEEDVVEAARVSLFDEVVARKPEGYDTMLGEGGDTLSGGEARRLMLARAAVRDAKLLLLDEPLTGLDPEARATIAQAIKSISGGRTTLVVSHGPADELRPDKTIRLESGRRTTAPSSKTTPAQAFFNRAELAAGVSCSWEILYPRHRGQWTALLKGPQDDPVYVRYDPQTDLFERAFPETDSDLAPLRDWLGKGELLGYRPSWKATLSVRGNGQPQYARIMTANKYQDLRSKLNTVTDMAVTYRTAFPRLAPVLHCEQQVIVAGSVSGKLLRTILGESEAWPGLALRRVGEALARFHGVPAAQELPRVASQPVNLTKVAERVGAVFPDQEILFEKTMSQLAYPIEQEGLWNRLVHGDLHDGNIFVDGDDVALIDLEYLGRGNPMRDVGNLCSELVVDTFKRGRSADVFGPLVGEFVDAYRGAGGQAPDKELLISGSHNLYRLACIYLFRRQWQHLSPLLLEQAVIWSKKAEATNS